MKTLLGASVILSLTLSVGAADFDRGTAPVLEAAKAGAKEGASLKGQELPAAPALWVTLGKADIPKLGALGFPLGPAILSSERAAIYRVDADKLGQLSAFMHETFGRCAGFFAHDTKAEAQADLKDPVARASMAYILDQSAIVKPLVARVSEGKLKATLDSLAAFNNRYYSAASGVEASRWIASQWTTLSAGLPGASVKLHTHANWKQPSVILTIPGSDLADEIVVLGGHLDSIGGWGGETARAPGVDDNASGIAVLTETVRLLGESGLKPRRTIQVMGYAAEEVGLRGSKDIASQYKKAGKKVVGVIQFDMTNFKGSPEEMFMLTDYTDPSLTAFLNQLVDAYVGVRRSTTKCGYACSDHASWNQQGYPAALSFESHFDTMNRNIHTDHDNLANAGGDAKHSVHFAKLGVAFAVELAKSAPSLRPAAGR